MALIKKELPLEHATNIPDSTAIWRYMDLPKFVSMLATGFLRFTKAATFRDDPYEGFCNAKHMEMSSLEDGPKCITYENEQEKTNISAAQMLAKLSRISADVCGSASKYLYVNSWCLASESMAMWEIYGAHGRGLAVKSTVGQYKQAAEFGVDQSHYKFGEVMYHNDISSAPEIVRDFSKGAIPLGPSLRRQVLTLAFHKRDCFEYEHEWRVALYQDERPETGGIDVDFDLNQFISAVYVGPRAEGFFYEVVKSIMDKFNLDKPLEHSTLLREPSKAKAGAGND